MALRGRNRITARDFEQAARNSASSQRARTIARRRGMGVRQRRADAARIRASRGALGG
jgi:hypothetical protein